MATRKLSSLVRIALKWLLFTGQRISETLMTEWVHLDAAGRQHQERQGSFRGSDDSDNRFT